MVAVATSPLSVFLPPLPPAPPLAASLFHPAVILVLCVVAGVGTLLILPGRREGAIRKIGAAVLVGVLFIFVAMLLRHTSAISASEIYFWIFAILAILGAVRVVSHPRPVYSALYFVLTVLASAGLFILAWAEFMAAALVLIYAGAILVTYVFVIMLASQAQSGGTGEGGDVGAEYDRVSREPLAASIAGFALMGVILFLIFDDAAIRRGDVSSAAPATQPALAAATQPVMVASDNDPAGTPGIVLTGEASAIRELGHYLFTEQLLTLELAGVILTLGMVGAIVIARKQVTEIPKETWGATTGPSEAENATGGVDDNPHSIPVFGTTNPQHKAYPET